MLRHLLISSLLASCTLNASALLDTSPTALTTEIKHALAEFASKEKDTPEQQPTRSLPEEKLFHRTYLGPIKPRAGIIGSLFLYMTPKQADKAIADVVKMMTDDPAFYFQHKTEDFKVARHIEHIVDQLSIIHEYLVRLRVRIPSGVTYHPVTAQPLAKGETSDYLIDYLLKVLQSEAVPRFLALSYDYVNRLFIEGIKAQNIERARYYYRELEYLEQNIRDSAYERDYSEHLTMARSIIDLLKAKIGFAGMTDDQIDTYIKNSKKDHENHAY